VLIRLLPPLIAAFLLTACLSDVPDEQSPPTGTPSPPSVSIATNPGVASVDPTVIAAPPRAFLTPIVTPTPLRRLIGASQGTTGIGVSESNDIRHDQACLDGETVGASRTPSATQTNLAADSTPEYPGPYEPLPFVQDDALQSLLDATLGDQAGSYAYYVKDLSTGRGAVHSGEQVFNAASLFKLFVMYEVFRQESLGLVDWNDELVVTPYYDSFALSPRVTSLCQVLTVGDAMEAMLSVSDNAAAVMLQDLVGSGSVNAAIEALGLQHSGLFEDGLPVTADDLGLLMEAIATGNAVSPAGSADMLRLLDHDVFDNGLVSGVPDGTIVSRKTGNWSDATNVAGVVYGPSGPYVFVALTTNGYETGVIRALSSATYGYFEALSTKSAP
jgi:hypothetical protein